MATKTDVPVGTRFGNWTTTSERFKFPGDKHYSVSVVCICGTRACMKSYVLTSGRATRCWVCYNQDRPKVVTPTQYVVNYVYGDYRKSARRRGLDFSLKKNELPDYIFNNCTYCGAPPKNTVKDRLVVPRELPKYNGLDRIDNSKGYSVSNVLPCCKWCNEAKRAKTPQEWAEWVSGLAKNANLTVALMEK